MKYLIFLSIFFTFGTNDFMISEPIKIGDKIPMFSLPDQNGDLVNIKDYIGNPLVVYFYPKDNTPGCTKEACSFRDSYEDFKEMSAEVIGISSDNEASHQQFASEYKLPFILLSDKNGEVETLFGVPRSMFGMLPGRVTYIINKKGIVVHIFSSQFSIDKHINEALAFIREME